jgi:polyferredoxin
MTGYINWKLLRRTLVPYQESYVELAAVLLVFFFALFFCVVKKRRQFWRHMVQVVSLLVFFFVVSSCLGVFGLIRNAFHGAGLIGKDDLRAFYFLSMTVVIVAAGFHSGAVFCGWICPTGSLQELVSKTRRLFHKRKRYVLRPTKIALGGLAVGMLLFVWIAYVAFSPRRPFPEDSAVLWATSLLVIITFSILFPKKERALKTFRLISLGLLVIFILLGISVYSPVHFVFSNVHDWASLLSTLVILLSGIWVARAWCRYLCPFGYVCSQLNRIALRRLTTSGECHGCGRCGEVCEVGAIEKGSINHAACTMCLACVDTCPSQCIGYISQGRALR